ncbi:YEATS domain-containing protein 4-like protein [Dinothrombium tinctorium]|uniref:YEATS domain-containing protein 4 n=1 Tax=Dinothrombium tinctorium TaxID=1965070 RepID=A0A3S3NVW2_9ACAR|nr:YEATS domain-containing protein 4-like protein [Dinothrombium tinctorium]RWS10171.1 YEATS domain-containing protein 4-like protein [Dinothrombium tinctorium]
MTSNTNGNKIIANSAVDGWGRLKGVTFVKPIVYGNVAHYFGHKRAEDGHTHQWTVYVKPFHNEDMSAYVKKVHFKLHESYANPNRVVTKPPYEVTETGWGEFEISIKIFFIDPQERPVTVYHLLKLFEVDPVSKQIVTKKNIVSEFYDEIVFNDPSPLLAQALNASRKLMVGSYVHETDFNARRDATIAKLNNAKNKVKREIEEMKEKLKIAQETIASYKEVIQSLELQKQDDSVDSIKETS